MGSRSARIARMGAAGAGLPAFEAAEWAEQGKMPNIGKEPFVLFEHFWEEFAELAMAGRRAMCCKGLG